MTTLYVAQLIADERGADLQRRAETARLAALVACCRPGTWARTARRVGEAVAGWRSARASGAPCCAPA